MTLSLYSFGLFASAGRAGVFSCACSRAGRLFSDLARAVAVALSGDSLSIAVAADGAGENLLASGGAGSLLSYLSSVAVLVVGVVIVNYIKFTAIGKSLTAAYLYPRSFRAFIEKLRII